MYPKEFKEEAVNLVIEQGYSVPEAVKSLGIGANLLYRWKLQIEDQQQGKTLAEHQSMFPSFIDKIRSTSIHG